MCVAHRDLPEARGAQRSAIVGRRLQLVSTQLAFANSCPFANRLLPQALAEIGQFDHLSGRNVLNIHPHVFGFDAGAYYLGMKIYLFTRYAAIGASLAAVVLITAVAIYVRRHETRLQSEAERALPGTLNTP